MYTTCPWITYIKLGSSLVFFSWFICTTCSSWSPRITLCRLFSSLQLFPTSLFVPWNMQMFAFQVPWRSSFIWNLQNLCMLNNLLNKKISFPSVVDSQPTIYWSSQEKRKCKHIISFPTIRLGVVGSEDKRREVSLLYPLLLAIILNCVHVHADWKDPSA